MKVFLAFFLGIAIGVAALWFYASKPSGSVGARTAQTGAPPAELKEKLRGLKLSPEDIREDLAQGGAVVRKSAEKAGQAIADATADARATASIKAKLVTHRELSAMNISVNTTIGVVTLSGIVNSREDISKAMALALDTDGVREVISTLQLKPPQKP